jgi:ferritin-like metal-binding protein YciE
VKSEQLNALLYEALETEICGTQVYEAAIRCAQNADLKKEWQKYLDETRNHERILKGVFEAFGLDPAAEPPGRKVVRHIGTSLVKAMEMAQQGGKPEQAEVVAAECVVHAETKDHMNWELIGKAVEELKGTEKEALQKAFEEVEEPPLSHEGLGQRALDPISGHAGRTAAARGEEERQDGHRRRARREGARRYGAPEVRLAAGSVLRQASNRRS